MAEHNNAGSEPLPSFITFEARAKVIGIAGLKVAVKHSAYPENMLTTEDLGMITPAIAAPYAQLLCHEAFNGPGAAVAYNGFYFAAVVGNCLIGNIGSPRTPPYPSIFRVLHDSEGRQIALDERTEYFEANPTLKTWVDAYVPMLDSRAEYPEVATTVAALTLKDIEQVERQGFIDAEVHFHTEGFLPPEL